MLEVGGGKWILKKIVGDWPHRQVGDGRLALKAGESSEVEIPATSRSLEQILNRNELLHLACIRLVEEF